MCKCNHKSRQDEQKCCCNCHGKSNMNKECSKKDISSVVEPTSDEERSYEKRNY